MMGGDTNIQSIAGMVHRLGASELIGGICFNGGMEPYSRSA